MCTKITLLYMYITSQSVYRIKAYTNTLLQKSVLETIYNYKITFLVCIECSNLINSVKIFIMPLSQGQVKEEVEIFYSIKFNMAKNIRRSYYVHHNI